MNKVLPNILILLVVLGGCNVVEERIIYESSAPPVRPVAATAEQPNAEIIERRFVASDSQNDAVQSAVTWANKYQQVVEQNADLRDQKNKLFVENTQLKRQLETAQADLARVRNELDEANEFLQEMHVELNKWKADVLGFREEMRLAQKAQLEALGRVLMILGAEPIQTQQ